MNTWKHYTKKTSLRIGRRNLPSPTHGGRLCLERRPQVQKQKVVGFALPRMATAIISLQHSITVHSTQHLYACCQPSCTYGSPSACCHILSMTLDLSDLTKAAQFILKAKIFTICCINLKKKIKITPSCSSDGAVEKSESEGNLTYPAHCLNLQDWILECDRLLWLAGNDKISVNLGDISLPLH